MHILTLAVQPASSSCCQDFNRAREIYKAAIRLIPHKRFTFAKLWIMFARFEMRRLDLAAARKTLGGAIGMCPKEALFKGYIQLELEVSLSTAVPTRDIHLSQ